MDKIIELLARQAKWLEPCQGSIHDVLMVKQHAINGVALTGYQMTKADAVNEILATPNANACAVHDKGNLPFILACVNNARLDIIYAMIQRAALQGLFR